jgi:hypothetical protein
MEQIHKIKTFIGNVLWSESEKRDQLLNGPDYVGCKHGNMIMYKEQGTIKSIDAENIAIEKFINKGSLAGNIDNLSTYIDKFNELTKYKNYSFVALNQGQNVRVKVNSSNIFAFTGTKKIGQYFDFEMYHDTVKTLTPCTYSAKQMTGFVHSGDLTSGHYLLQTIKANSNKNHDTNVIAVVGFRNTALTQFVTQNPSVVIVNDEEEILYVIPSPLDEVTMRNSTMAILATVKRDGDYMNVSVLLKPHSIDNVDTGCTNNVVRNLVRNAILEHSLVISTDVDREIVRVKNNTDLPKKLIFIQKGTKYVVDEPCFMFGRGLEWIEHYTPMDKDEITLSPFGILRGPSLISLQQSYHGNITLDESSFLASIDDCTSVIIHINDDWLEAVVKINDVLINGLIIVHTELNNMTIEQCMSKLNITGVSAIAGPLATILVQIDDTLYWYRGVANYGITTLPSFAQDVTDQVTYISNDYPNVYYRDEVLMIWKGEMTDIDVAKSDILKMSCDQIVENTDSIKMLFTQLQIINNARDLNKIINDVSKFLIEKIDQVVTVKSKAIDTTILTNVELMRYIADNKGERKRTQKLLKPLIEHIGSLISQQKSVNKIYDLKQLQRVATISDNVSKAMSMTVDDKIELLSKYSNSVLFAKINVGTFRTMIKGIPDKTVTFPSENLITIDPDMLQIDIDVTQDLLEVTKHNNKHELYSENGIAINTRGLEVFMPLIINNSMIDCKDPSKIFWVNECNLEEWSMFRIMMRNTIASSKSGKNMKIVPQDKQVGYMIIDIIVNSMEHIALSMTGEENFNNNSCQLMRGLFGQLFTTISSGANPMSMAWQLVMKNPNIDTPKDDMWIYMKIIRLLKFTGWSTVNLNKNIVKLLSKIIKNKICGKAIKNMQDQISVAKADEQKDYIVSRDIELKHCQIMTDTILYCVENEINFKNQDAIEMCGRAIELYDIDKVKIINRLESTKRLYQYFNRIVNKTLSDKDEVELYKLAVNIYTRRSACFARSKKDILDALTTQINVNETIHTFAEFRKQIKESFAYEGKLLIQNRDALAEKDRLRIKGDAELMRIPWRINKDESDHATNIQYVLGEGNISINISNEIIAEKVKKTFLMDVRGNQNALQLHSDSKIDIESVIEMTMPFQDVEFLLYSLNVEDHHSTLFKMIETALLNYNDGDECYNQVNNVLTAIIK